jgi:hypothetical protein
VDVGRGDAVKGNGVNVSGSVGNSVGVSKTGMYVTPGVIVGTFGTHNLSPAKMMSEYDLQLARSILLKETRYRTAMW